MDNEENQKPTRDFWAIPTPEWEHWKTVRRTRLWMATALLCDVEPDHFGNSFYPDILDTVLKRPTAKFMDLLMLAKSSLGRELKPVALNIENLENSEVDLVAFATWAKSLGITLPNGFPWQPDMNLPLAGWPWGNYETELLQKLALAANRFWKNYDPADPTTAPTNQAVIEWLKAQGVASRTAEVMATILRADGLPTGPRK